MALYKDIYDLVERVNLNSLNKKNLEAMAVAGAFDCFPEHNQGPVFFARHKRIKLY